MPIEVECPKCGGLLRLEERLAGKQVECTECGNPMTVPETAAPPVEEEKVEAKAESATEVSFEDKMAIQAERIRRQQQVPFAVRHTKAIFRVIGLVVIVAVAMNVPWLIRRVQVQGDISLLKTGGKAERQSAAKHLVKVVNPTAFSALIEFVRDEDRTVRCHCIEALGKLGDKRASPALVEALDDGDVAVTRAAAWALAGCGDENARGPLLALLRARDPDDPIVVSARFALYRIGDSEQFSELILALGSAEYAARTTASEALVAIGRKDAIPMIRDAIDRSPEDAHATMEETIRKLKPR